MFYNSKRIKCSMMLFLSILIAVMPYFSSSAYAQTSGGFSVHAVIPDNQIDTKQTYFDLYMQPGEEQTLEVVINNTRDEKLIAEVQLNAASTGRNGLIVYTEPEVRDESMKVSITDVAALQSENVTVPAHGSKTVRIKIKMPDEPVDGVILGGISVTSGEPEYEDQVSQGITLKNKITYIIALKLTESDIEEAADFDLASIAPELINFRTAVVATLQNKAARIVKGMEISAQVFRKGSDTMIHEFANANAEMAPLSKGDFVIDWGNQPLDRGTYRLKMTADYDGETWVWDEEFTIGGEASDLNNAAVGLVRDYTWLYLLLGIATLIVFWLVAYREGKRRRPNEGAQT